MLQMAARQWCMSQTMANQHFRALLFNHLLLVTSRAAVYQYLYMQCDNGQWNWNILHRINFLRFNFYEQIFVRKFFRFTWEFSKRLNEKTTLTPCFYCQMRSKFQKKTDPLYFIKNYDPPPPIRYLKKSWPTIPGAPRPTGQLIYINGHPLTWFQITVSTVDLSIIENIPAKNYCHYTTSSMFYAGSTQVWGHTVSVSHDLTWPGLGLPCCINRYCS